MAYYLKMEGLQGESTDAAHKDQIEIESWSWGETNSGGTVAGSRKGGSNVDFHDLNFTMFVNKVSADLFLACANGKHFKQVELFATKGLPGGKQADYLAFKMSDVMVSSYNVSASSEVVPLENVSLNFNKLEFEYKPQAATGKAGSFKAGWDVSKNVSV